VKELVQFATPDGQPYFLRVDRGFDIYHDHAAINGLFDHVPRLLWGLVSPGAVFFDLGANIGTISIPMAAKGAMVHAIDILPENVAALEAAAAATGLNLNIHEMAIWSHEGTLAIGGTSAWGRIVEAGERKVRAVSLDGFCRLHQIEKIDVIKIDIEGSELAALTGMKRVLSRCHPDIVFELNVHCINGMYSYNDIILLLEGYGYRFYRIWPNSLSPFVRNGYQESVCCDYLASVRPRDEIGKKTGFQIVEATEEDEIDSIVRHEQLLPVHRLYAYSAIDRARPGVRNDPRVRQLMEGWEVLAAANPERVNRLKAGAAPRFGWRDLFCFLRQNR